MSSSTSSRQDEGEVAAPDEPFVVLFDHDVVTLLNPLEADRYLSRERDADDRRRHVVTITRRGEQQLERAAQAQRDAEDELFAGLTKTQRAQLRRLLLALREQSTATADTACTAAEANTRG